MNDDVIHHRSLAMFVAVSILTASGNGNNQWHQDHPRRGLIRQEDAGFMPSNVLVQRALATGQLSPSAKAYLANTHIDRTQPGVGVFAEHPEFGGAYAPGVSPAVRRDLEQTFGDSMAVEATQHELVHRLSMESPAYRSEAAQGFPVLQDFLSQYPEFTAALRDNLGRDVSDDPAHQFVSIVQTRGWTTLPPKLRDYFRWAMDPSYR